jgi:ubiquinone/menaquinone biosynthesis C-methylase UbiE
MQTLDKDTKFAHLGKPGSSFSKGFQRRLDIITKLIDFKDKKILDLGCGEGVWIAKWLEMTAPENVYGEDIDPENINKILNSKYEVPNKLEMQNSKNPNAINLVASNFKACPAEKLEFPDNTFDIVFSNEVMEHVKDDVQVMKEVLRVLKPGGKYVFFTPNRGWPFETHGMFFRGKYIWGNIPFLPWMPKKIFNKFAPHVRNYSNGEIKNMISSSQYPVPSNQKDKNDWKLVYHKHVFPAFDKLERKFGMLGKLLQKTFHFLEKTPLHFFGISHLVIVQKT